LQVLERQQREQEERLTRLERMHKCTDHLRYHQALDEQAREYWWGEGITDESIARYLLGYCPSCPTDQEHRPSYTIPVINDGHLENIRHRLKDVTTDKYRPHMAGLGVQLFNADTLAARPVEVVVVEGEKKSIVLGQAGFPNVGIVGKRAFRPEWVERFGGMTVYVALDPDAHESAVKLGGMLKPVARQVRVVSLPMKVDDMIAKAGAGADDLRAFFHQGRPM
jgi:DNA primase